MVCLESQVLKCDHIVLMIYTHTLIPTFRF